MTNPKNKALTKAIEDEVEKFNDVWLDTDRGIASQKKAVRQSLTRIAKLQDSLTRQEIESKWMGEQRVREDLDIIADPDNTLQDIKNIGFNTAHAEGLKIVRGEV